jgi:hypothetical protein
MRRAKIKVTRDTRDRLAKIAAERGVSVSGLIEEFAAKTRTRDEVRTSHEQTLAVIRRYFVPDFNEDDIEKGRQLWRDLAAGRLKSLR